ncbi:arsenate reductase ArsC [Candidatus Cloacimonadota bacterium]
MKIKVLFVCIHNSARSQMAEALLQFHGRDQFQVESAGLEPGNLNPLAISAMHEMGIDISDNETSSVFDFRNEDRAYDYVITVCDESQSERCPIFPGNSKKLHWSFEDPSSLEGEQSEKLQKTIKIRNQIEAKIKEFVTNII